MADVRASTLINTGPEPIWELMNSPERYPDFVEATDRMVDAGSGEFGDGYVYKEYGGLKPFKGESEWRVTAFEPMTHQRHVGDDGKVKIVLDIDLTPSDGGTQLALNVALEPRWFIKPVLAVMWPLSMRKRAQADMDTTVANVKHHIEAAG